MYVKINFVSLGATLLRIGLLLILASGHTGRVPQEFRFSIFRRLGKMRKYLDRNDWLHVILLDGTTTLVAKN